MRIYEEGSVLIKSIAEPTRLQIIDILSNGEMCACDILQNLTISQSTLSHHMKALTAAGWVISRKKATWMYYSINENNVEKMHQFILNMTSKKHNSEKLIRRSCGCSNSDDDCHCLPTKD